MISLAIMLFVIGAVCIGAGIAVILKPTLGWYSQQQWKFKDEVPEPSESYISFRKFTGLFILLVGVMFVIGGVLNCLQASQ